MSLKEYAVSHIVNLIKIKSVLTLALTAAFVILALRGDIQADQFLVIFTTVIGFYFGTQNGKAEAEPTAEEEPKEPELPQPAIEPEKDTDEYHED